MVEKIKLSELMKMIINLEIDETQLKEYVQEDVDNSRAFFYTYFIP